MLIFSVPGWYKSDSNPENCIFIYEQMQALKSSGNKIIVLAVHQAPIYSPEKASKEIKVVDDNGIITYSIAVPTLCPSKLRYLYIFEFEFALRKMIKKAIADYGTPDLFYAHFSFPAGYAMIRLKGNTPLVVQEHYSLLMEKHDSKLDRMVKKTVFSSDAFICVSDGLRKVVNNISGIEKAEVVTNMINPCFKFHPLKKKNEFVFFSMGGLIKRKGFDLLIKAFAEEFHNEERVTLRIAGEGGERENLENLIQKYDFSSRIKLIGQLSREKTLIEYSGCNCFVLASRAETYGLVYREAMAVGRPIISTKHGGFGSDWSDKMGYLIDIDDLEALKKSMRKIYENYETYDLELISKICLKECASKSVAERLEETFKRISRNESNDVF